jgi:DNA-binding transcriptional LysR family regulator
MVGLRSLTTGTLRPLEFPGRRNLAQMVLPAAISVTGTESYLASARLGLGLVQVPRFHADADLERGALLHLLSDCPPPSVPVLLLYPRNRQLSPRVRVFLDWVAREFASSAR